MSVGEFASRVALLALRYQLSATSWGRSVSRNEQVGGVPRSLHLVWLGVDLVSDRAIDNTAVALTAKQLGLRVLIEADHLHVEPM